MIGHAKVDTTLNVYTQVVDGSLRRAADTVGSELFTIVHKPEAIGRACLAVALSWFEAARGPRAGLALMQRARSAKLQLI